MGQVETMRQKVKRYIDNADESIIKMIYAMMEADVDSDWWGNMPDNIKEDVAAALQESESGILTSHETIQKRYQKWLVK